MRAAARRTIRRGGGALDRDNTRKRVEFMKRRQSQVSHRRCRVLGLRPVQRLRLPPVSAPQTATPVRQTNESRAKVRLLASDSQRAPPLGRAFSCIDADFTESPCQHFDMGVRPPMRKSDAACAANTRKKLWNSLRNSGPFADEKMRAMMSV